MLGGESNYGRCHLQRTGQKERQKRSIQFKKPLNMASRKEDIQPNWKPANRIKRETGQLLTFGPFSNRNMTDLHGVQDNCNAFIIQSALHLSITRSKNGHY